MPATRSLAQAPIPDDLNAIRVRAEITLRLTRHAARVLDQAQTMLAPVTNGITGPEVAYATRYVEAFLGRLTETPKDEQ